MNIFLDKHLKNITFIFGLCASVLSCSHSNLPLGEKGLEEYIFEFIDVGFEFDYEIANYKKLDVGKIESKRTGKREGLNEFFTLHINQATHSKILSIIKKDGEWNIIDVTNKPLGEHPRFYAHQKITAYYNESMVAQIKVYNDKQVIEIYLNEIPFSFYAN